MQKVDLEMWILDSNDINILPHISLPVRSDTPARNTRMHLEDRATRWSAAREHNMVSSSFFYVFHVRRDVQAARGWHGCRRAFGETPRSRTESNAIVTLARCFYQDFSSLT